MTPAELLALLSGLLRTANAIAEAVATLNNGGELSPEQIESIQTAKAESESNWADALARLKGGAS